jgi:hypothetical protein
VNRAELVARMNQASSELLRQKGFISFVDILIHMGKLTREDYESWRMRRIPYLERAIRLNLSQLNHLRRTVRQNAVKGRLQPRKTAYVSWGKGRKLPLRFSKSGHPAIEEAYATHFVKRKESVRDTPPDPSSADRGGPGVPGAREAREQVNSQIDHRRYCSSSRAVPIQCT